MSTQRRLTEADLPDYLRALGVVGDETQLSVEKAGDGNINWVRRVRTLPEGPSFVVKQARPALERFPRYQAPTERIVCEARYYATVGPWDREAVCPRVHHFDAAERVLILEDLGDAERLDHALGRGFDASSVAARLGAFLGRVHGLGAEAGLAGRFANEAMRRLHGEHIFRLPLRENDFALPPELAEPAEALRADAALVALADAAHARYLEARAALVHGDVQAGNVLLAGERPVLLDAEIAHVGDPDFDLGTLLAHLALPAVAVGEGGRAVSALEAALAAAECADARAAVRYAGFELLRRTLGAARVAAVETAEASRAVLEVALTWIREPAARARDLPL